VDSQAKEASASAQPKVIKKKIIKVKKLVPKTGATPLNKAKKSSDSQTDKQQDKAALAPNAS
jgi:hypothetical protein